MFRACPLVLVTHEPGTSTSLATTNVHCEVTPAEAHVAPPGGIAMRHGFLEGSAGVEMAVVIEEATTSHSVTARQVSDRDTTAPLARSASDTIQHEGHS